MSEIPSCLSYVSVYVLQHGGPGFWDTALGCRITAPAKRIWACRSSAFTHHPMLHSKTLLRYIVKFGCHSCLRKNNLKQVLDLCTVKILSIFATICVLSRGMKIKIW